MKGMDVMATRGVMPLGAEQGNVLQSPSIAIDGQDMSFAKSFGEVAAGAVGTTPAGQMLKGNAAPVTGPMEKLLNISAGGGLNATTTPATAFANSGEAVTVAQGVSTQNSEKLVDVVDGNTAAGNASLQSAGIKISDGAIPVSNEKPIGPIGDMAEDHEALGTKIDLVPAPIASKVVQPVLAGNEDQPVVQKKEAAAVSSGKPVVEKTAKKELKNSSVASANSTNVSTPVEVSTQVGMTVTAGSVSLVVAKAQAIDTAAEGDSKVVAASGQVPGIAGAKTAKSRAYGDDRGTVVTGASSVSKDGTVAAAKADDGVAGTKKDESDSSKAAAGTVSANVLNEGAIHGSGGVVAMPAVHSVLAVTGNVAGDAVAVKASANANTAATAGGQDGASQSAASIGEGHRTLETTSTSLEVGVANGTQGWLKIRAEMTDGGVVNASVSATTSAGQEMLHRELSSLTAYLQQEQIGVGSVVLQTTAGAGSQELAGGMERDAGREQMQQRGGREGESRQDASGTSFSDSGEAYVQGGLSGIAEITTSTVYAGGSWLSVRA